MVGSRTMLFAADARLAERAFRRLAPLDEKELRAGLALLRARHLARGEHFLRAGTRATELAIVTEGLLREYFLLADGVERTKAFVAEGQLSGSLADLLSSGPSRAYIVADEDTRILVAPYERFRALSVTSPAWAKLGRVAAEQLLVTKSEREYELLGLDAEARYAAFATRYPGLEGRALGRHVASYLGITPVHLSRLRRRRRSQAHATKK
jgi:CRP-like cAMP-binding protein